MKDLVQLIKDNPGSVVVLDNDCWWLYACPEKPIESMTSEEHDKFLEGRLATDEDTTPLNCGYVKHHLYGGGVMLAMAQILGIKCEPV